VAAAAARRLVPAPEREPAGDALTLWAERSGRRRGAEPARGALRFAFYGRVSTEDYQDPVTSRARQLGQAAALVAGSGQITAEFFDAGQSRVLPWARRPQAAALLAAVADPGRGFDAIVIGEYERAFYGSQYTLMAPLFEHYGLQLWLPETAAQSTSGPRGRRRRCSRLASSPSGRSPGPGSGSTPRWPPRPVSKDATSVADRRMGTGCRMRARTR